MRRLGMVGDHRGDEAGMTRTQPPQMQIADAVAVHFQPFAQRAGQPAVRHHVEQHRAGRAQQADRPTQDHRHADQRHQRVHPDPAVKAAG